MRRLTLAEVDEQHGGKLPPDAVLRADDEPPPAPPPKPKARHPRGRGERFAVLNAFTDCTLADLTGAEAKVWLILYRDTKASGIARTGQADIARRAGLSPRGVRKALAMLDAKGRVRTVRRCRLNAGPSAYRVHATGIA